jgi:hypothetical protein
MVAHPRMTPREIEAELSTAVHRFYSAGNVALRLARGLLGVAGMYTYFEGGLVRRRRLGARREAVGDEEARRRWLGAAEPVRVALPDGIRDDARMESLPILRRHAFAASDAAP